MYSKATIVGRLGAAPAAKEGANGKSYYMWVECPCRRPDEWLGRWNHWHCTWLTLMPQLFARLVEASEAQRQRR
jgi:hypothetical protein